MTTKYGSRRCQVSPGHQGQGWWCPVNSGNFPRPPWSHWHQMSKWLNPSEPSLLHLYRGENKNYLRIMEKTKGSHSAWEQKASSVRCWGRLWNRWTVLTFLLEVPSSQSPRWRSFWEVIPGSWSSGWSGEGPDGWNRDEEKPTQRCIIELGALKTPGLSPTRAPSEEPRRTHLKYFHPSHRRRVWGVLIHQLLTPWSQGFSQRMLTPGFSKYV